MIDFKGHRFEKDLILTGVRWYLAYPLSYRNLAEMMAERGVEVDHSHIYRWVQKFTPQLEAAFRQGKKRPVGNRWRRDETYLKIQGPSTRMARPSTWLFLSIPRKRKNGAAHKTFRFTMFGMIGAVALEAPLLLIGVVPTLAL
jgi:transposase-like protein